RRATAGSRAAPARGSCPSRHWRRPRPTRRGPTPRSAWPRPRPEWDAARSLQNLVSFAAGRRPFLDARPMVVVAVAGAPHGMDERAIGRRLVGEGLRDRGETGERRIGLGVAAPLLELDRAIPAGRLAALEHHVGERGDRAARRNLGEAALAQ